MGYIIVNKQKHDTYYYPASTEEEKYSSIKKIYKANKEMSYYDNFTNKNFKDHMSYLEKQVLKHQDLAEVEKKHKEEYDLKRTEELILRYKRETQEFIKEKKIYDICETGDVKAMEQFLKMRSNNQYEGFEICRLG